MRRFTKGMLITAGIFGTVGVGLTIAGVAMGANISDMEIPGFIREKIEWVEESAADEHHDLKEIQDTVNDSGSTSTKTVQKKEADEADVYDLQYQPLNFEFELRSDELILEEGDSYQVYVYEDDGNDVTVKEDRGTLKIISKRKKSDTASTQNYKIRVLYPKDVTLDELEIELGAGQILFDRDVETKTLNLELGAGEFTNSGAITTREADLEVGAGNMELSDLSAKEINGECGVGDMTLSVTGESVDYNYDLECGIGTISIDAESYSGFAKEKHISNGADRSVDLECGMGNISVDFTEKDHRI